MNLKTFLATWLNYTLNTSPKVRSDVALYFFTYLHLTIFACGCKAARSLIRVVVAVVVVVVVEMIMT